MSKYLSYKYRHVLRRAMAMVFAVILALSPLQLFVMAESSYLSPIESTSIEWEYISMPTDNNEDVTIPSGNNASEAATDENNATETGTEEQPSTNNNNNEETPSTPPTGDGATDEPSSEENATEEPSGDAGSDTDTPSEDATDEPSDSDDATEPGTDEDNATEPGTEDPTEEESTDEPTEEEEPTEEPTDILGLLPLLIPAIGFSDTHWIVNFWEDNTMSTLLSTFQTEIDDVTTIDSSHWPPTPIDPTGQGHHFIGWYVVGSPVSIPVDLPTFVVDGSVDLYPRFSLGGVLQFRDRVGDIIHPTIMTHVLADGNVDGIAQNQRPSVIDAQVDDGAITYWYNEAFPPSHLDHNDHIFFHIDGRPSPAAHGLVVLHPASAATVQVIFNLHGGSMMPVGTSNIQEVFAGSAVAAPTDPQRHGWYFRHWSEIDPSVSQENADLAYLEANAFDFDTPIPDGGIDLHAVWYGEHDVFVGFSLQLMTRENNVLNVNASNSWFVRQPLTIAADEFNFPLGHVLDQNDIQLLIDTFQRGNPRVTNVHINNSIPADVTFVPSNQLRQSGPLNADGTTIVRLFFDNVPFDVVVDLSQEGENVTLTSNGVTYRNNSENQYTFTTFSVVAIANNSFNSINMHRFPRISNVRTQAQINSGFATVFRDDYLIQDWQWTDGEFTNTRNADGTWVVAHGNSGRIDNANIPNNPDAPQTITMRPIWLPLSEEERRVELATVTLSQVPFSEFRQLITYDPNGSRIPIHLPSLLNSEVDFDTQWTTATANAFTVYEPGRSIVGPSYFRFSSRVISFPLESAVNSSWHVVWNEDYTRAIRYVLNPRGHRQIIFDAGIGSFAENTPNLNANGTVVVPSMLDSWPTLLNPSTLEIVQPPMPIPPDGMLFYGWFAGGGANIALVPPNISPITGLFTSNGATNHADTTIHARYIPFPPVLRIEDGLGNPIMTPEATLQFTPNPENPPINAGQSLSNLGITNLNNLIQPEFRFTTGQIVQGRGTFDSWRAINPSTGGMVTFTTAIPMNAGEWTVIPWFTRGNNTVTFIDENNNQHATRSVFTDPALINNTIARGGGTNRTMPAIPNGGNRPGHRFVWTTESNGNGAIFNASSQVLGDMNVYAFFEPWVDIAYTTRVWGLDASNNNITGGNVENTMTQTIPARFGRNTLAFVEPTVQNNIVPFSNATYLAGWAFGGWYLAGAADNAAPLSTDPLFIPSRDATTNLFETATYEARFQAVLNFRSGNTTQGTVSSTSQTLYPNQTAQSVTATVTNAERYVFVNWTNALGDIVSTNPTLTSADMRESASIGMLAPDTFQANFMEPGQATIEYRMAPVPNHSGAVGGLLTETIEFVSIREPATGSSVQTTFEGFDFVGWSVGSPTATIIDTDYDEVFAPDIPANGWDNTEVFAVYAHFVETSDTVQLRYQAANTRGTVRPANALSGVAGQAQINESVRPISGTPVGATAIAASGFVFSHWSTDLLGAEFVSDEATFVPQPETVNTASNVQVFTAQTFYAHFLEDEHSVTIHFEVSTISNPVAGGTLSSDALPTAGGSVSNDIIENLSPTDAGGIDPDEDGSTPTANDGFSFVRWALDANNATPAVWAWSNNPGLPANTLVPQRETVQGNEIFVSRIYYAIFQPIPRTITFNNLNGVAHNNVTAFNVTTPTITLNAPANRTGFEFEGWYSTSDFALGAEVTEITQGTTANVTLWARWQANAHTITYQSGDGTGANHVVDVVFGDTHTILISAPSGFTAPTGHHFDGWTIGGIATTDTTIDVTGNVILVAVWSPNAYTITYQSGAGTGANHVVDVVFGDTHTMLTSVPSGFTAPTGHHFDGWTIGGVATTDTTIDVTDNVILVAVWSPDAHTITYQSGAGTGANHVVDVVFGDTHTILTSAPSSFTAPTGHHFDGWTIGGIATTDTTIDVTDNVILVAVWSPDAHTITYQSGAGIGANHVVNVVFGDTHTILTSAPSGFAAPTGHHFDGWTIGGIATTDTTIDVTDNVILVAIWTPNAHSITYASGTGTGPNHVIPVLFGGVHTILTAAPSSFTAPTGHHFDGWTIGGVAVTSTTINVTGDVTLVAVWTPDAHTVTYVDGTQTSGTVPAVVDTTFGASVTVEGQGNLVRTGHTFGGWNDGTTIHAANDTLTITGDVTLTAVWNPIDYTVTFNENLQGSTLGDVTGFVPDSMTSVHYNATVDVPANENSLSRTGHTLLGWDRNANATNPEFPLANASNSFTMPAANVTLYAIWEIQEREVIFVNNHDVTDNTEHDRASTDYGSTLTLPTPPSRTGYDFVGWFTARTGGTPFTANTAVFTDTTVYARWQAYSHTITFQHDPLGGTGNLPDTIPTYFDEVETVPGQGSMVRNGYTFVGWRDSISNSVLTENAPLTVSGNHELTAVWSRDGRFAVIYNANWPSLGDQDGQVPTSAYGNDYYTGQTVTVLDNNTLEVTGHTFLGWSRDANTITPDYVDGNTFAMGTTHVTLYAVWQIQERTLTYSVGTGAGTPPPAQTVDWSSPVTVSGQGGMSKEGHTFGDWTDADGNPVAEDAVLSLTDNMTLTAVWNINSYNVTYNANITGGAGAGEISGMPSPSTVSVVFNQPHNITATPSRVGHTFAGWATSPTATASDVVTSITMVVGDVNLYAVWTPINYAVTFDLNLQGSNLGTIGGAVPNAITGRNYANVVIVPVNENSLTRTGHTLLGWSRNANATTATYVANDTFNMPAADVTLYAVWQRQTREVTFIRNHDADDNTQVTSVTVLYGASLDAIMPAELTRSGHDSLGWFDARTGGIAFTASTVVTSNKNVYAQWQIQDRTITFANHETAEFIGGDLPATITVDYGTVVSIPDVGVTRRGYEFTVWTDVDDTEFASGDNWPLYEDLELTANWNRLDRFAVIYNANGGILGNLSGDTPAGGDDYLPGETVTVLGYNTLERTGHTFLGWSTDNNATIAEYVEGETFAMLDANVTLYAVWQINQHEITVRHNTFAWDEAYTNAVEYDYETFTIYYGDDFEAEIIDIASHNFYADASDELVIAIMGDATVEINLFYQQHAYEFTLSIDDEIVTEIALDVNNRFPAADNALTWDEFTALFDVTTINLDADAYTGTTILPAPVLYSPNFQDVDFDNLTNETPFAVTVDAVWPDGQHYSLDIDVHIVDNIAPTIIIAQSRVSFRTDAPPANMQAVIDAIGIVVEDNFDEAEDITVEVVFSGGRTFNDIAWTEAYDYREYAVIITAEDQSGNTASEIVLVVVEPADEPGDITLGLTITTQPTANASLNLINGVITVTQGAISGYLEIEAIANAGAVLTYQWYNNSVAVAGATSARMYIPTDLAVGTHNFQVMVTATINPSYSIMSNIIAVNVVAPSIPPTDEPSDEPSDEPGISLPPSDGGDDSDTGSSNGGDNNNAGGGNNNDVENDNNNDTTNNDTDNQDETESNDVDEDTTPETALPETPATPAPTAPITSVVEAEAPVNEIATESAPLPLTTADNMIQYGDMWIELDDAGVPMGAWNWDEETEMWIFDENVPLGAFGAVLGTAYAVASTAVMPETGLTSNVGILAIFIAFALVIATAAFVLIKREQKNRNA